MPKNAGCKLFFVNVPDVPVQNVNEKRTTVHGQRILYNLEYLEQWNIGTQTTPKSAYLLGKSCSTIVFHKGVNTWNTWNIFPRASKCTLVACRIHIRQADDHSGYCHVMDSTPRNLLAQLSMNGHTDIHGSIDMVKLAMLPDCFPR